MKGEKKHQNYVWKNAKHQKFPCSSSISFIDGIAVKLNGKKVSKLEKPLSSYHKHSNCIHSDEDIQTILSVENMKARAKNENLSVIKFTYK